MKKAIYLLMLLGLSAKAYSTPESEFGAEFALSIDLSAFDDFDDGLGMGSPMDSYFPEDGELTPLGRGLALPTSPLPPYLPQSRILLGSGAYGKAWLVQREDGNTMVIKSINANKAATATHGKGIVTIAEAEAHLKKLFVEIKALHAVSGHPNIPAYIGSNIVDGGNELEIATEKAPGVCLDAQPINERQLRSLMKQLLSALDHCHLRGVAHLDVKPQNILYDAAHDHLSLVDWGEARFFADCSSPLIERHLSPGTLAYRPGSAEMHMPVFFAATNNAVALDNFAAGKTCEKIYTHPKFSSANHEAIRSFITQLKSGETSPPSFLLATDPWLNSPDGK
jgi:hypothetical protein